MTTILMTQALQRQGEIWHNILSSQNLTVTWENLDADILAVLEGMEAAGLALPQLLLLDMGMTVTNPYRFCQVAQSRWPGIPVVITAGHDPQISAAERRWALRMGAVDLLPGIQESSLIATAVSHLTRVLEILDALPIQQDALMESLSRLTAPTPVPTPTAPPPPPLAAPPATPNTQYRGISTVADTAPTPKGEDEGQRRRRYRGSSY
ncbi:MAG TPA: response regulator [Thermosynechococcus sp. M98_K2018_005]|uniref:response regulator n=1 Tax=Thermosynechococcus sp. M98_K2018_005 TaxID=2747811 RepID=UPI0019DA6D09|nr:response regulator [Thermosynechococcus sp. M98_K2018_005]HIK34509.1 response regulator [Thermosynechococcus sp. M98_K2018_005]